MVDLSTNYAGLTLRSPIIVSSAGITEKVDRMKKAEDNDVGAVVMKTLYEREILRHPPSPRIKIIHHNLNNFKTFSLYSYELGLHIPESYAKEIERAKNELSIPVIGSISCATDEGWFSYTHLVENAGADAIELNLSCPIDPSKIAGDDNIEKIISIVKSVKANINIPIIVKITPQLSNPVETVKKIENAGANAVVIFNKFTGLEIDIEKGKPIMHSYYGGLTGPWILPYVLKWITVLHPKVKIQISSSGGVTSSEDVIKYILAGATTVQVCTIVILKGYEILKELNQGLIKYMERKGYNNLFDFRGKIAYNIISPEKIKKEKIKTKINNKLCNNCGLCEKICYFGAIRKINKRYKITEDCDGVGLCVEVCPRGAIELVKIEE